MKHPFFAAVLLAAAGSTNATVVYTYTGGVFDEFISPWPSGWAEMGVTPTQLRITLEFDAPIPANFEGTVNPVSSTWTDGVTSFTCNQSGACDSGFHLVFATYVRTDSSGNFEGWQFGARDPMVPPATPFLTDIMTRYQWNNQTVELELNDVVAYFKCWPNSLPCDNVARSHPVGSWSVAVVPLPASIWLLGCAVMALGAVPSLQRRGPSEDGRGLSTGQPSCRPAPRGLD